MKHTPGPWRIVDMPQEGAPHIAAGTTNDDMTLVAAIIWPYETEGWRAEDEANARLIASAPELLEALERVERLMGFGIFPKAVRLSAEEAMLIRAAIKKARGEREEDATVRNTQPN